MNQRKTDESYLRMAHVWGSNSNARKRKVGALIVKDRMIISDGFNGTPSGFSNICENYIHPSSGCEIRANSWEELDSVQDKGYSLVTKVEVLHAEANAITKVAKSTQSCEGATMYCTDAPCIHCAKLIVQSGIRRLVYDREYHSTEGLDLVLRAGIVVERINLSEQ